MLLIMMLSLLSFVYLTSIDLFGFSYCLGTPMEIQTKDITESMPYERMLSRASICSRRKYLATLCMLGRLDAFVSLPIVAQISE